MELNRSLSDLEDEIEWIDDSDWYFNTTPEPPLRRLTESRDGMKMFEPLINVTEEEQERRLAEMEKLYSEEEIEEPEERSGPRSYSPDEAFSMLSKPVRRLLKQYCNTEMCHEVDRNLRELLASERAEHHFAWRDPFQRKLGHALSRFYCMTSYSKDADDGRITVVAKTGDRLFPMISAVEYLLDE